MDQIDGIGRRVAIIGGGTAESAILRESFSDRASGVVADRQTIYTSGTKAARWSNEDQAAYVHREEERERADWNQAVDAKKAARQLRRNKRRWSRA